MDIKKSKRKLTGKIIKLSSDKTVKVRIEKKFPHPKYGKIIKEHKNYLVHNEIEGLNVNDKVEIEETKPISKSKTWKLIRKL